MNRKGGEHGSVKRFQREERQSSGPGTGFGDRARVMPREGRPGYKAMAEARGRESVEHVMAVLGQITTFSGEPMVTQIEESEKWSKLDMQGIDLTVKLEREIGMLLGIDEVTIQVVSSEDLVHVFCETGKKKFGVTGEQWRKWNLVLLDGQWANGVLVADFMIQLMNLSGFWGVDDEVADFLKLVDSRTRELVNRHELQVEEYRHMVIDWVQRAYNPGVPLRIEGKTKFY